MNGYTQFLASPGYRQVYTGIPGPPGPAGSGAWGTITGTVTDQADLVAYIASQIATAVTGLLDLKGSTNCSGNPNYPAASKGDVYIVSAAGKIGGASGKSVDVGDVYLATADNAGGTEASVGTSWIVLEHNILSGAVRPVAFFFTSTPTTSEVLLLYTASENITFADDFGGSVGDVGVNPTSSFVLDVQKNGASVGSVTIATGGGFTFSTTGGAVSLVAGDQLKIVAPASADATVANVSITLMGAI